MSNTEPFKITVLHSNSVRVVLFTLVQLLIYWYKQINLIILRKLGSLNGESISSTRESFSLKCFRWSQGDSG